MALQLETLIISGVPAFNDRFSLISILAALGNTFFATRESQKLGENYSRDIYEKVEKFLRTFF